MATKQQWTDFRNGLEDAATWETHFDEDGISLNCELTVDETLMLNWRIRHLYNALDQSGIEYEMTSVILVTFTPKS